MENSIVTIVLNNEKVDWGEGMFSSVLRFQRFVVDCIERDVKLFKVG